MAGDSLRASSETRRFDQGFIAPHPSIRKDAVDVEGYLQSHQVYTKEYLNSVTPSHRNPNTWYELLGWWWHVAVRTLVALAAWLLSPSGWGQEEFRPATLPLRMSFFAAAGQVVGTAGALANHLKSWVLARPDNGWVHTLLMEGECCRMHSGILVSISRPSLPSRLLLLAIQAQVFLQYLVVYLLAPGMAHAYSAYRAEEQCFNLSEASRAAQRGSLRDWRGRPAPPLAKSYYALPPGAPLHEALLRMRADEACIHHMNTVFAQLNPCDRNPFITTGGRTREE